MAVFISALVWTDFSQQLLDTFAIKFGPPCPLRMNCNNFAHRLTFLLAPSSGQNFSLSNTLVYDHIPEKVMTFPSASAVLSAGDQMLAC